jgi:hypothetical protein
MPEEIQEQTAEETEVVTPPEADLETQTLLTEITALMGTDVTEERLGAAFAWAKANTTDDHLQNLVTIADTHGPQSHGAIVMLLNRHTAAAIAQPVGTRLSDRVIKRTMSQTAQVPVTAPIDTPAPNFITNETKSIVDSAKVSGVIPTASEIIARLKLEQGTN